MAEDFCPKCKSPEIKVTDPSYPRSFECKKCGYMFLEAKRSLTDE